MTKSMTLIADDPDEYGCSCSRDMCLDDTRRSIMGDCQNLMPRATPPCNDKLATCGKMHDKAALSRPVYRGQDRT